MTTNYTLKQCSDLLQTKQSSAVELAQDYLSAIEAANADINAFVTIDKERTLLEARLADERLGSATAGALTGVPVAYKDIFCQQGWRSACASRMLDSFV